MGQKQSDLRSADLLRCDREIERIRNEDNVNTPAWLVAMGICDWEYEKELILKEQDYQTLSGMLEKPPILPESVGNQVGIYTGILIALGIVYSNDAETVAEEIVKACDHRELLRVAKREEDCYLPNLKKTVAFLKSTGKI